MNFDTSDLEFSFVLSKNGKNYRVSTFPKEDLKKLEELYYASSDYFLTVFDRKPNATDAPALLEQLPPGKSLADKFVFGIYDEEKGEKDELVGVLDLIRDYPEEGTWFLGLLLLHPDQRGNGLGEIIFSTVAERLRDSGANKIRISVVKQNDKALRFWKRLGFVEDGEREEEGRKFVYLNYLL